MKKVLTISVFAVLAVAVISCDKPRRNAGSAYMPDMYYSRAIETYSALDTAIFTSSRAEAGGKIFYNRLPVGGAVARGDMAAYALKQDVGADSTNYVASRSVKNPLDIASIDMKEAERLYLVNCGICHGTKLDGNGPLYASGAYAAKPATLVGDAKYEAMPEGMMFHSVTYGKNQMGSYASQLNTRQRWMVIAYIKSKQVKPAAAATAVKVDSVAAKK
ncbi:MAG: cytochrome c [Bacteroidetes bacterium]|nr:MAG: cytochrome c [Bacteroidota bacterium]